MPVRQQISAALQTRLCVRPNIGRHRCVPEFAKARQLNPPIVAKHFFAEERLIVLARYGKATGRRYAHQGLAHLGPKVSAELGIAPLAPWLEHEQVHTVW